MTPQPCPSPCVYEPLHQPGVYYCFTAGDLQVARGPPFCVLCYQAECQDPGEAHPHTASTAGTVTPTRGLDCRAKEGNVFELRFVFDIIKVILPLRVNVHTAGGMGEFEVVGCEGTSPTLALTRGQTYTLLQVSGTVTTVGRSVLPRRTPPTGCTPWVWRTVLRGPTQSIAMACIGT